MKKLGVIRLFICLAAIITELLPLGAVLKYGLMSDNGHLIFRFENYSCFDVTPFGYAMFHYMICAVTTTITAMLSLLWIFFGKKRQTPITVLSAIALAMSAVPYIIMTFNVFTVIISALLAAVLVISVVMQIKHEQKGLMLWHVHPTRSRKFFISKKCSVRNQTSFTL